MITQIRAFFPGLLTRYLAARGPRLRRAAKSPGLACGCDHSYHEFGVHAPGWQA